MSTFFGLKSSYYTDVYDVCPYVSHFLEILKHLLQDIKKVGDKCFLVGLSIVIDVCVHNMSYRALHVCVILYIDSSVVCDACMCAGSGVCLYTCAAQQFSHSSFIVWSRSLYVDSLNVFLRKFLIFT